MKRQHYTRMQVFMAGLVAFCVFGIVFANGQGALGTMFIWEQWISVGLLGAVNLWTLLFKKSALLVLITQAGVLLATLLLVLSCDNIFASDWCSEQGTLWLFHWATITLYSTTLLFVLRHTMTKELWQMGGAFGVFAAALYMLILPAIEMANATLYASVLASVERLLHFVVFFILPFGLLSWLTWMMMQEKRGKTWKQVFAT